MTLARVPVYKLPTLHLKQHEQPIHTRPECHKNWARWTNSSVGLLERSWPQLVENALCVWVLGHACMHTCVCVSLDPNLHLSQAERELMWGWHFAGICRTLNQFYVWDLGFWYPPPPFFSLSSWPGTQIVGPYMCAAAVGQYRARGFFEASCCHDTNLLSRASSRAMARYTADSGITRKESEQERWRERRGWRGSDGELGDIMSIYAETHVQDLLTFFGQQILDSALVRKELQATPLIEQPCSNLVWRFTCMQISCMICLFQIKFYSDQVLLWSCFIH